MAPGRKSDPTSSSWKRRDKFGPDSLSGPEAGFLAATLACLAAWGISQAVLPSDMAMPIVAIFFLALACVLGLVASHHRGMDPAVVTYADAAGALALIGLFAAATIDPDQLVRLVESRTEH